MTSFWWDNEELMEIIDKIETEKVTRGWFTFPIPQIPSTTSLLEIFVR